MSKYQSIAISALVNAMTLLSISPGSFSTSFILLLLASMDLICSQSINPFVLHLFPIGTCNGNPLSVFVTGRTMMKLVFSLNVSLLMTTAGLYPACSLPDVGLKLTMIILPCCITIFPRLQVFPSLSPWTQFSLYTLQRHRST